MRHRECRDCDEQLALHAVPDATHCKCGGDWPCAVLEARPSWGKGRPRCLGCGDKFTVSAYRRVACSIRCGSLIVERLIDAGADLSALLPGNQRPDLVPWDAWQAATKINGKKQWLK